MTLNERIKELEKLVQKLTSKITDLTKNVEEKRLSPHSKVGIPYGLENRDVVHVNGIWKTYAIYKDDEEETEE